jgi:mutator protein MutT
MNTPDSSKERHFFPDGRVHGVVAACQRDDGRWLLIRRSKHVAAPRQVCFPGGGMELGETQEETLVREMREEVGAIVEPVRRVWHFVHPERNLVLWGWIASLKNADLKPDPMEVEETFWLTEREVVSHPDVMRYTDHFVREIQAALRQGPG